MPVIGMGLFIGDSFRKAAQDISSVHIVESTLFLFAVAIQNTTNNAL